MAAGELAQSRWWARASLAILLIAGWTVLIGIGTTFAQVAGEPNFWPPEVVTYSCRCRMPTGRQEKKMRFTWRIRHACEKGANSV
jgi:hypothetical protein